MIAAPARTPEDVLRLAASLDQYSPHVLAHAVVDAARERGMRLSPPADVAEEPGRGATGTVEGQPMAVGRLAADAERPEWVRAAENRALLDGSALVWLTVDGRPAGAVGLRDPLRRDAARTLRRLRDAGVQRLVLLTGDRSEPAREAAAVLGLDAVHAELTPEGKIAAVRAEREHALTVMVGATG